MVVKETHKMTHITLFDKIKSLKQKYYLPGAYLLDLKPETVSAISLDNWVETIHSKYLVNKTYKAFTLFKNTPLETGFTISFIKPIKEYHQWEFENLFGFGGHCGGFTTEKVVMVIGAPSINPDEKLEKIVENYENTKEYTVELIRFLMFNKYFNSLKAYTELLNFIRENYKLDVEFDTTNTGMYLPM
jgi:hypothetical protein